MRYVCYYYWKFTQIINKYLHAHAQRVQVKNQQILTQLKIKQKKSFTNIKF